MTEDKAQDARNDKAKDAAGGADDLGSLPPSALLGESFAPTPRAPSGGESTSDDIRAEEQDTISAPASGDLPENDPDADLAAAPLTAAETPAKAARGGGFLPMALGGVVAAALGFGAASYLQSGSLWPASGATADLADRLAAQELALAALGERLDAAPGAPDITPLSREIADLRADLVAATDALRPELAALADRVGALEARPAGEGGDGATLDALLADVRGQWEEELSALKSALGAQDLRIEAIAAEANARLTAAQEEIAGIEAAATSAAEDIARRGALSRVLAAIDAGGGFTEALAEAVADAPMPQMLASLAESGVPTLAALQAQFPEAARAALATARAEGLAGEEGGFVGFLRSQFDVRSTAERAGDDPDAILSRAEARLGEYDLDAALAEIATLPEVVRAAMGDWLTLADTRKAALAEADALSDALSDAPNEN